MRVISCNLVTVTSVTWLRLRLRVPRHMESELRNYTVAWLRGYVVTQLISPPFSNLFSTCVTRLCHNQGNLVTVTVTQTHGERVPHLHCSLVTWLRNIFLNFFPPFFSTYVTVTVTSEPGYGYGYADTW